MPIRPLAVSLTAPAAASATSGTGVALACGFPTG
jgi:hypothetical protein